MGTRRDEYPKGRGLYPEAIKVLHILDHLTDGSGVSRVVSNYIKWQDDPLTKQDVAVYGKIDLDLLKTVRDKGGQVYALPPVSIADFRSYQTAFSQLIRDRDYDVVHGHIANAGFLYLPLAKKANIPLRIIHAHNAAGSDVLWKRLRNRFFEIPLPCWANCLVACSDKAADYLFTSNKARESVFFLPNAIDTEVFRFQATMREHIRSKWGVSEDTVCIGHIGRFVPQKNHFFLIEAFDQYHRHCRNSRLFLIGEGPLEMKIRRQIKDRRLIDHVVLLGKQENTSQFYQGFDLFWLPSCFEGLPLVAVEAQSAGLPCLLSDKITKMAALTSATQFASIENAEDWAETAIHHHRQCESIMREFAWLEIVEQGYDIQSQGRQLTAFYRERLTDLRGWVFGGG